MSRGVIESRFPDLPQACGVRIAGVGGAEESVPLRGSTGESGLAEGKMLSFCWSVYSKSFSLKDADPVGPLFDQLVLQV